MSAWKPKDLWERVLRAVEAEDDEGVDDATLMSHLLFIAPVFLAFVMLVRR